jgi:hypothetical protein
MRNFINALIARNLLDVKDTSNNTGKVVKRIFNCKVCSNRSCLFLMIRFRIELLLDGSNECNLAESDDQSSIVYQVDCSTDESSQTTQCVIVQVDNSELHLVNDAGRVVYIDQPHSSSEVNIVSQHEHESALAMLEFREQYRC